ncbi:hypothetical protein QAD02_009318 [Eretmocerus hayati]|uniref:Uncharacterized protein n=1 Tax=Eretmocerus hayati TaxID=131215 RepID=A0ACC2N8Z1_9HYME|nr:hypothetical protein QAD02_009318 [Eretmocerus hayati]
MDHTTGYITTIDPRFKWKLADVSTRFMKCEKGEKILSPMFTLSDTADLYWQIYLIPKPINVTDPEPLGIYLKSLNTVSCFVGYKFYVLDERDKKIFYVDRWTREIFAPGAIIGTNNFGIKSKIFELVDNSASKNLVIICELELMMKNIDNRYSVKPNMVNTSEWWFKLEALDCFERLLFNPQHSDIKFIVKGGKELPAHKNFLAARSPVFDAMLGPNFKESQENEIKIEDMDIEILKEILRFIYIGKVNKIDHLLQDLLIAADRYQLEGLKEICKQRLYETLSIDNAIDYLKVADLFHLKQFKKFILNFICLNGEKMGKHPYVDQLADLDKSLSMEVLQKLLVKDIDKDDDTVTNG